TDVTNPLDDLAGPERAHGEASEVCAQNQAGRVEDLDGNPERDEGTKKAHGKLNDARSDDELAALHPPRTASGHRPTPFVRAHKARTFAGSCVDPLASPGEMRLGRDRW